MQSIFPLFSPLGAIFWGASFNVVEEGPPLLFNKHYFTVKINISFQAQCKTECVSMT